MKTLHSLPMKLILTLSILMSLLGCTASISRRDSACLSPLVNVAYPYQVERDAINVSSSKEISSAWKPQLTEDQMKLVSESQKDVSFFHASVDDIEIKNKDIWYGSGQYIFLYKLNTRELHYFKLPDKTSLNDLLIDSQGTVWAALNGSSGSPLMRFDFGSNQFLSVASNNKSFDLSLPPSTPYLQTWARNTKIFETSDQKLWILLNGNLWLFDTRLEEADLVLGRENNVVGFDMAIAQDKTIWLIANKDNVPVAAVYTYDPIRGSLQIVSEIPGWTVDYFEGYGHRLAVDSDGRLWISNYAWIELLPQPKDMGGYEIRATPFLIVENPVFVSEPARTTYGYSSATNVKTHSDGSMWFSAPSGIVRLDAAQDEWCLFAKGIDVAVAEDPAGNVWFADGQLYKYELEK